MNNNGLTVIKKVIILKQQGQKYPCAHYQRNNNVDTMYIIIRTGYP